MPTANRRAEGKHTQSVIFKKDCGWTKENSRSWLKAHKYFTDGHDETDTSHRWRQYDPDAKRFRYSNDVIEKKREKNSIILVLGFPLESSKENNGGESPKTETTVEGGKKTESTMSLGKDIKRAEEKIVSLEGELSKHGQAVKDLTAERDLARDTIEKNLKAFEAEKTALAAEKEKILADHAAALKALEGDKAKALADLIAARKELDEARALLANPAFQQAQAPGTKPVADGGDAAPEKTETLWDKYNKIEDPVARSKFYNDHEAELKAEGRALFKM